MIEITHNTASGPQIVPVGSSMPTAKAASTLEPAFSAVFAQGDDANGLGLAAVAALPKSDDDPGKSVDLPDEDSEFDPALLDVLGLPSTMPVVPSPRFGAANVATGAAPEPNGPDTPVRAGFHQNVAGTTTELASAGEISVADAPDASVEIPVTWDSPPALPLLRGDRPASTVADDDTDPLMAPSSMGLPDDTAVHPLPPNAAVSTIAILHPPLPRRSAAPDLLPSNAETAWRQKWLGEPVPGDSVPNTEATTAGGKTTAASVQAWPANTAGLFAGSPDHDVAAAADISVTAKTLPLVTDLAGEAASRRPDPTQLPMPSVVLLQGPADALSGEGSDLDPFGLPPLGPAAPQAIGTAQPASPGLIPPFLAASVAPALIAMMKSGHDGPVELALSPEELGRLTISIQQDGDFVRIAVMADRPETLDLMRRHAGDLVADLRQAGFSGASLSFSQGGKDHDTRFAQTRRYEDAAPASALPDLEPTPPNRLPARRGVDLRF